MAELTTKYLNLTLKNPLLVSSSSLTNSIENLKEAEEAGAGGVILKSLFEEQVIAENKEALEDASQEWHTEAYDYVSRLSMEYGPDKYIKLIEKSKEECHIPIIASLNCVDSQWWVDYAKKIQLAGADALEINMSILPTKKETQPEDVEKRYYQIIQSVKKTVDIPVSVKIGPYFTSLPHLVKNMEELGADGFTLFNRFYHFDIDLDEIKLKPAYSYSHPVEIFPALRWVSLLSGEIQGDLSATTGIHGSDEALKFILAGAGTVQLCSTLFINGFKRIGQMVYEMEQWLSKHEFNHIDEIRGKLSRSAAKYPEEFERLQYIKGLTGVE